MPKKKTLLQGVMDYDVRYVTAAIYIEPKLDGWGIFLRWVENEVKAFTHTGTAMDLPEHCKQAAEVLPKGFFFHAELTHPLGWQHIKGAIAYDHTALIANIFDMVSEEFFTSGVDLRGYTMRKKALYTALKVELPSVDFICSSNGCPNLTVIAGIRVEMDNISAAHQTHLAAGYEGSVLKRPNSLCNLGKTTDWLRMKPVPTQDCEIIEVVRDEKGSVKSLRVLDERGVSCKVASSSFITQFTLTVENGIDNGEGRKIDFEYSHDMPIVGRIIEVAYHRLTEAGRMREPRFVRFREDKQSREDKYSNE